MQFPVIFSVYFIKLQKIMKRFRLILAIITAVVLASCTGTLAQRFDSFVSSVEDDCFDYPYSEEYWMAKDSGFKRLYNEYRKKMSSFTSDEKRDLNSAIARYEFQRINSFVSYVEKNSSKFSEDDWLGANERFKILYDEYQEKRSFFTSAEKRDLNSAIARYEFQRINSFVSYVEENASEFSEDDWLGANERFIELAREYKENRHAYNSSEKRKIDSAILHYFGLVLRSKIPSAIDKIRLILRELGLSF